MCSMDPTAQKQSYLGNHVELLEHMRLSNMSRMTTTAVWKWLQQHDKIPHAFSKQGLMLEDLSIDHILPTSIGGVDHPFNYSVMPKELNNNFDGWWTEEKKNYMGALNTEIIKQFRLFVLAEGERLGIDYNAFDPKRHTY